MFEKVGIINRVLIGQVDVASETRVRLLESNDGHLRGDAGNVLEIRDG